MQLAQRSKHPALILIVAISVAPITGALVPSVPPWSRRMKTSPPLHLRLPQLDTALKMTRFRPCIDLHAGQVKQIVGGTLDSSTSELKTNYVSKHPAGYYAKLYRDNALEGAHVIMLGPGNDEAAQEALAAWPGHLQVGGGINDKNAALWIERGASKVSNSQNAIPVGYAKWLYDITAGRSDSC